MLRYKSLDEHIQIVSYSFSTLKILVFQLYITPLLASILALFSHFLRGICMLLAKHAVVLKSKLLSCCSYKYSFIPTSKCKFRLNFHTIISSITLYLSTILINYTLFKHLSLINYVLNTSTRIFSNWEGLYAFFSTTTSLGE
jgi:hypothetical protein